METLTVLRSSFSCFSQNQSTRLDLSLVGSKPLICRAWIQQRPSNFGIRLSSRKLGNSNRKRTGIRATMQPSDSESFAGPIAPLQLESPIGQFLSQILISHPHLVPAAIEQQLEQLQSDNDAQNQKEEPAASGTELALYRRIAEVKANERKNSLEDILYALVVQKFMDASVPLISTITPSSQENFGRANTWPSQEEKLKLLHSPEAYEMVQNHLSLILGNRLGNSSTLAEISKLKVGQVYAASVMYGYFLKRIDQRFQLEKKLKNLPQGQDSNFQQVVADEMKPSDEIIRNAGTHPEMSTWSAGNQSGGFTGIKPSKLRSYVMSFDGETLQKYATIRSKEAVCIIEKHTEALFGKPEIVITPDGTIDSSKDEIIKISFEGLKRLVLEAVTFGSFLWDVESYVDSRCHFVAN